MQNFYLKARNQQKTNLTQQMNEFEFNFYHDEKFAKQFIIDQIRSY